MNVFKLLQAQGGPKFAPKPVLAAKPKKVFKTPAVVYTDGGCNAKLDSIGAFAWRATMQGFEVKHHVEARMGTTNNRMEMMAVYHALKTLDPVHPVNVFTDSMYVINGATKWVAGWIEKGWLTFDGNAVKNRVLWEALYEQLQGRDVHFHHVKGHSGVEGNEFVDALCTKAIKDAHAWAQAGEAVVYDDFHGVP